MPSKAELKQEIDRLRRENARLEIALQKAKNSPPTPPPTPQPSLIERVEDAVWGVIDKWLPPWV